MERFSQYQMNIASELVMFTVLLLLFVTCMLQRKRVPTAMSLSILILLDMLLLLCQLSEWFMMAAGCRQGAQTALRLFPWKKAAYTADYSLYYFLSVAYYNYVTAHIRDKSRERDGLPAKKRGWQIRALLGWGAVVTAVFAVGVSDSRFFYLDAAGNEAFRIGIYCAVWMLGTPGTLFSVVTLFRHRKELGTVNFTLLITYIITPGLLFIPDLIMSGCFSYLIVGFYVIILYIHVDLRGRELLTEREAQLARQEKELADRNAQIMLSQIRPHFLYNTLTTVSSLCYIEGAEQAKQVVDRFSDYLRANLDSLGGESYIRFEVELKHIENYLWLESVRFGDALRVEYDIEASDFRLPSLSIQPLVENAVKHGIRRKKGGGTVTLRTRETETEYLVIVEDDGAGFVVGSVPDDGRSHVGIDNIRSRLKLLCGGSCELRSTVGQGTIATVHIPKETGK